MIITPLLVFILLASLSTWGVLWSASLQKAALIKRGHTLAKSTGLALQISLFMSIQPVLGMSVYVREFPDWNMLRPRFDRMAPGIMAEAARAVSVELHAKLYNEKLSCKVQ